MSAVERPSKEAIAAAIADHLGLDVPAVSAGGSVSSLFLDDIYGALFGGSSGGVDTYRKTDLLLSRLGLVYDPWWDTSESRTAGGGTVTTRAFSRILSAIADRPRCFIVNWWNLTDQTTLEFFTQADLNPFAEAGPGSMVLIVDEPVGEFVRAYAWAEVVDMTPGWRQAPWFATVGARTNFEVPVGVAVDGLRAGPLRLTEISWEDFQAVVGSGAFRGDPAPPPPTDGGAQRIAQRIDRDYPAEVVPIGVVRIPPPDPSPLAVAPLNQPDYEETENDGKSVVTATDPQQPGQRGGTDQTANRLAESRAITYATRALEADGWTLDCDCQKDGVGYDLLFTRAGRRLTVEVKGIQGPTLIFNVTPKEWWRATTDPDWIVVAVTSVLSPTAPKVNVVTRRRVASAKRVPLGYRVWIG